MENSTPSTRTGAAPLNECDPLWTGTTATVSTHRLPSQGLSKFSLTATQAILYFDSFVPGDTVKVKLRLRAKYPIRARTFRSRVYEYYAPEVSSVARPVQLEVRKR